MGEPTVMVGVVDIGTNSMRLLITDGHQELGRWVEVTGLGRGLDSSGMLSRAGMDTTIPVLEKYGQTMDEHGVEKRLAIATSASRDAANRESFFDRAESALGVRPTLISAEIEGRYAFAGAISDLKLDRPIVVTDIGGGSTEFVTADQVQSIDVGTVRLGDRALSQRPPSRGELEIAGSILREALADVEAFDVGSHVGVAGTWTSLASTAIGLDTYDPEVVHGSRLTVASLDDLVARLSTLTIEETRRIPGLDPKRAPVILPGAIIARAVMETLRVAQTIVSERDTLDGAAMELMGIA